MLFVWFDELVDFFDLCYTMYDIKRIKGVSQYGYGIVKVEYQRRVIQELC